MKFKKYSVLMSIYKGVLSEHLIVSINSMLNQTLKPNEIILVLDGPLTNELIKIVRQYKERYDNLFTIVKIKKNVGLGLALNEGLKASRNEIIFRMDTDDISLNDRCEVQMGILSFDPNISILGSPVDEFQDNPANIKTTREVPLHHENIVSFSKRRNPFNHPTVVYKKSEVLSVGGYKDYRRNQDLDLFVRMILKGFITRNHSEPLVLFRADGDNIKRRKSWEKTKSYISLIYYFYKKGHSTLKDFLIVLLSQLLFFVIPGFLAEILTKKFLRKKHN